MTRLPACCRVVASPGPSMRSGGSGRFQSCADQRFVVNLYGSRGDMKSGLRELTALSLLGAFCCGLAWAPDDTSAQDRSWKDAAKCRSPKDGVCGKCPKAHKNPYAGAVDVGDLLH